MAEVEKARRNSAKIQTIKFEDFLSKYPPGEVHSITDLGISRSPLSIPILIKPRLKLHCPDSFCNGVRFFDSYQTQKVTLTQKWSRVFLHYSCSNCRSRSKIFAIMARWNDAADEGEAVKLGEWPPFGPQVSLGIISILGKNKDMFLMGRRAEIHGLGIGAFAYYRRVIESQKDHIIDEIIRVLRRTNSPETQIEKLKSAKTEKQFKKAVALISDAIPQALLINGYNPLALLEQAIAKGSDAQHDNEALKLATAIRIILTELAERLIRALEDQTDLDTAVDFILQHD
ncbi:MAG: hypothetical protein KAS40_13595 [Desulfobacterales bacterium]|jgi:hypothetical protein|nr:hypothetical protein [Desulfobacterales bacterium]